MKLSFLVSVLSLAILAPSLQAQQPAPPKPPAGEKSDLNDYLSFPASRVKIRQPENFAKAEGFEGFGQPETQSSVMALSVAGPYSKITAAFSQEQMKVQGWTFRSREEVKIDGVPGMLVHFEQPAGGRVFVKWSLAFGDEQKTTMVTATFPKEREGALSARLKAAVLSTRLDGSAPSDPGAAVPFTLAASAKLKLAPVMSGGLLYTKDGVIPAKSPKDPLFIAAPSLGKVAVGDKRQYAERRLQATPYAKGLVVKSTDAISISGLEGYESLAEAEDAKSGTPVIVYQVMLFDEGSYILIGGLVGVELRDEYLPEFKAMARSLKKKQP